MSQAINCSSCGAANQLADGKDSMLCVFCGSAIIKIKQANDYADPAADPKIKNYLELAHNAMESSEFDEAIKYFNKVLEQNPKISETWYGKGYSSGWGGSLGSIKVDQMILNFNKAIEYASEIELQDLKIKIADANDGCAYSIYNLSYKHTLEFAQVDGTYIKHLSRSTDVLAALELAYSLNPQSKEVIKSILDISKNLLEPITFKNYDEKWESLSLDKSSAKKIQEIYNKYFQLMGDIDSEYVAKVKQKEKKTQNLRLIVFGIISIVILFLFAKSCNNSSWESASSKSFNYQSEPAMTISLPAPPNPAYAPVDSAQLNIVDPVNSINVDEIKSQSYDVLENEVNSHFDAGSYAIVNLERFNYTKRQYGHDGDDLILTDVHWQKGGIEVGVHVGSQSWEIRPSQEGYFYLIPNKERTKCLDVYMARIDNGGEVLAWEQHEGDNQKWRIVGKDEFYYIISKLSDKYLGARDNGELFIDDLNGSDCQKWIFKKQF